VLQEKDFFIQIAIITT